jgi:hypothetical protein
MSNLRKITTLNSITNGDANAEDRNTPLTLSRWLELSNLSINKAELYITDYNNYITTWNKTKASNTKTSVDTVDLYKTLLEQVAVNYTSDEEKRFLQNIDYDDPGDIDATIPFFAKRLKEITLYLSEKREDIKQQPVKFSLAGTNKGITILIRKIIVQLLSDYNFINSNNITSISTQELQSIRINVNELFDVNDQYHDIDPSIDKSTYTSKDTTRNKLFRNESIEYDPYIWIDFEQAIQNLLSKNISGVLGESQISSLLTDKLENVQIRSAYGIDDLHESHFFNYIKSKENLNLHIIKKLVEESSSTNMYYVSTDSSGPYIKKLFTGSKQQQNLYNINNPTRANIPENILYSTQLLGGSFTPHLLGNYAFNSKILNYNLITSKIKDGKLYVIPDPEVYGSEDSIIRYEEDLSHIRCNNLNVSSIEIKPNTTNPLFYSYQSKQEVSPIVTAGISKVTDSFDFWKTGSEKVWNNADTFLYKHSNKQSSINNRQSKLLHKHATVYKYKTDIYGNEYALFKTIKPQSQTTATAFNNRCASEGSARFSNTDVLNSEYMESNQTAPRTQTTGTFNIADFTADTYDSQGFTYTSFPNILNGGDMLHTIGYQTPRTGYSFLPQLASNTSTYSCVIIQGEALPEDFYSASITLCGTCSGWNCTSGVSSTNWDGKSFTSKGYEFCSSIDLSVYDIDIVGRVDVTPYASTLEGTSEQSSSTLDTATRNNLSNPVSLYAQQTTNGELWFRNINNTIIDKFSNVFKSVIAKYSGASVPGLSAVSTELKSNKIRDIEIIQDVLIIETQGYVIVERINYDHNTNKVLASTNENIYFTLPTDNLSHVIKPFYNEKEGVVIFGYTEQTICAEDTIFVPRLYSVDVDNLHITTLTSLSSSNVRYNFRLPVDIHHIGFRGYSNINRPVLTYNNDLQKYTLITFGTLCYLDGCLSTSDHTCVIKSDYKYTPTSNDFTLIDNTMYCLEDTKLLPLSAEYTGQSKDIYQYLNTSQIDYPITVNTHTFTVTFDCEIVKQKGDTGQTYQHRDSKIIKIEYDFGDGSPHMFIDRKLTYNSDDSGTISTISVDNDIGDPRLQKVKHTYYTSGDVESTITATVKIIYASGFTDIKYVNITCNKFTSNNTFNSVNLIDAQAFTDQSNKETTLLTFELGDDTTNNPRYLSTVALY